MRPTLSESEAMRREWVAGGLAFFVSFGVAFGATIYFLVVHLLPAEGWIETLAAGVRMLVLAVLFGLAGTCLAMAVVQRRHYAMGVYRCWQCNRVLRGVRQSCVCRPRERRGEGRPRRRMRHYRRAVRPVLLTYLALLGPALLIAYFAPRPRVTPADFAFLHGLLCVLIGVLIELSNAALGWLGRGRRFRLRSVIFLRVLAIWPLAMCIAGLTSHAFGHDPLSHG